MIDHFQSDYLSVDFEFHWMSQAGIVSIENLIICCSELVN